MKRRSAQLNGMRRVYLVASELCRLGFIASPTSRGALGADILVTDQECKETFSIQVKTNASTTFAFWLLTKKARTMASPNYIYVFVNIRNRKGVESIEYYIVPSAIVAKKMVSGTTKNKKRAWKEWHQFNIPDAKPYLNDWSPIT